MKILSLIALTAFILTPTASIAEETDDLIPVRAVDLSIEHKSYMEPDQFAIIMRVPNAVSGCYKLSGLEYQTSFIENNFMDIMVDGYRREVVKTENPSFDCNKNNQVVSAMIVVSANDLRGRGIRQLRFNNGNVEDVYDLRFSSGAVQLESERPLVFKAKNKTLTHNVTGRGMIALHVPMAKKGEDVSDAVRTLALDNALISDAPDKNPNDHVFFFSDPSGMTLGQLGDGGHLELGTVPVMRPYDGPNGRQMIAIPLKVFATHPETTL